MKTNILLSGMLALISGTVLAQHIESDPVYFRSKDRAALRARQAEASNDTYAYNTKRNKSQQDEAVEDSVNPTDSYSSRNVNPEYAARANARSAQQDNGDYFDSNYRYQTTSNLNNWNNNFNRWYSNPWYTSSWFGSSINSWNSPYYGYSNPYNSPWYDPYWNYNGWSSSFSYYYGSNWNYGWGGNYNYWNYPYAYGGFSPGWSMGWGMGNSWYPWNAYGYGFGYPGYIVVVHQGNTGADHVNNNVSRRTRTIAPVSSADYYNRGSARPNGGTGGRTAGTSGRVDANSANAQYYERAWRRMDASQNNSGSTRNSSSWGGNNNSAWGGNNNSGNATRRYNYDNSSFGTPNHSSTPSFNTGGGGFGGGARSGGTVSGGSGGGGGSSRRGH